MNLTRSLILASRSPRRQELMKAAGFEFEVKATSIEENVPSDLEPHEVAVHLAQKKALALSQFWESHLVLAADTIVVLDGQIMGKPTGTEDGIRMLTELSGQEHQVITGIALNTNYRQDSFFDTTRVWFNPLTRGEIEHYIYKYKPLDKAGAYGIQEWIGMIGIKKIEGSYFNVVGLPMHLVYQRLENFDPIAGC